MSTLTLYHALLSTCSQKVRYTLAFKQLAYDERIISLAASEHLSDWYLAINPNGVVPALRHGDAAIVDSSVICEYLDETFADHPLTPGDPVGRAQMRAWMRYFEEVPTTAIRAPSFNQLFVKSIARQPAAETERLRLRRPLRKHFYAKMGPSGFSADVIDESLDRLDACLERVERALQGGGPYLLGEAMSLADIVLLPSVVRMDDLGMSGQWTHRPCVTNWLDRMQAHPAFALAYAPGSRPGDAEFMAPPAMAPAL